MSRRYAHQKTDANHAAIVEALRKVGCSVTSLASVGGGCPDILVGRMGRTWLFELKDGKKPPSARKLNEAELAWFARWRGGRAAVVESVEQALAEVLPMMRDFLERVAATRNQEQMATTGSDYRAINCADCGVVYGQKYGVKKGRCPKCQKRRAARLRQEKCRDPA